MLVISRRKGQRITIGDDVELVVTALHRSSVKLGIRAPQGCVVLRGEVHDSIERANREALESSLEAGAELTTGAPQPMKTFALRARLAGRQAADAGPRQAGDADPTTPARASHATSSLTNPSAESPAGEGAPAETEAE